VHAAEVSQGPAKRASERGGIRGGLHHFFRANVDGGRTNAVESGMQLRARLVAEFQRRRRRNSRYSLRAFAQSLETHHSTVARILHGERRPSGPTIDRICRRLGLDEREVARSRAAEHAQSIVQLVTRTDFRPDCRWIATMTGIALDDVNRALHLLLQERRLLMNTTTRWTVNES
jgi:transcriptional regulator with XRE-family HTH domain